LRKRVNNYGGCKKAPPAFLAAAKLAAIKLGRANRESSAKDFGEVIRITEAAGAGDGLDAELACDKQAGCPLHTLAKNEFRGWKSFNLREQTAEMRPAEACDVGEPLHIERLFQMTAYVRGGAFDGLVALVPSAEFLPGEKVVEEEIPVEIPAEEKEESSEEEEEE